MERLKVFRICPLHTNSEIFRADQALDHKTFAEQDRAAEAGEIIAELTAS